MSRFASTLALAVLSPLLALLTLAIRLDSRGPVFYRQTRVGLEGRPFRIFKFRTMIPEANPRNSWPWVAATGAPR
ncbi:MAG: sugar transferase [Actinobacteria bacterium]|nr:sugar transferase [Actinomycetota bacterium]